MLAKGERQAGTILLVLRNSRTIPTLWERMPKADGSRIWTLIRTQDIENTEEFDQYLERRKRQDDDLWIVELDVPNPERFIGESS